MTNAKRLTVFLAACLLTIGMTGCGKADPDEGGAAETGSETTVPESGEDESTETPADAEETESSDETGASEETGAEEEDAAPGAFVGMPNPMKDVTAAGLADETGFALKAPEGSTGVRYFTVEGGNALTAQMDFDYNGKSYTYRVMPSAETKAVDTTGLYYSWTETKEIPVGGCTATLNLGNEAAGMYWLDIAPGVNYSLSCSSAASEAEMTETAALLFAPVQGNAEGDVDYSGMFLNGSAEAGCDFVTTNRKNDGSYDVQVSIFRLSTFSGTGSVTDGALEMTLTDPNGGEMNTVFYPENDGTYSLKVTVSTWPLLEEETVFAGFKLSE